MLEASRCSSEVHEQQDRKQLLANHLGLPAVAAAADLPQYLS
jgi:hypothetical protein